MAPAVAHSSNASQIIQITRGGDLRGELFVLKILYREAKLGILIVNEINNIRGYVEVGGNSDSFQRKTFGRY